MPNSRSVPDSTRRRPRVARASLREGVREEVFRRILTSDLAPGRSVGEIALGEAIGASRTPLREALIELQGEGFLEHDPGRGFVVRPLSVAELREVYPIIAALDALAVELAPSHDPALVARLRDLNARFGAARPAKRVELDTEWHECLATAAGNARMHAMLRTLRRVVQRYEVAYLSDETLVRRSTREHEAIVVAIEAGRRAKASELLRAHWNGSIERLIAVLEAGGTGRRRTSTGR